MSNVLYIILGTVFGVLVVLLVIFLYFKKKSQVKDPSINRAEEMMIMINQRILSLNSRIEKLDKEITTLLASKENKDSTFIDIGVSLEEIPNKIEDNKSKINEYIADINDLQDYKLEIEAIIVAKGDRDLKKLTELLDLVKEKFQYRYI